MKKRLAIQQMTDLDQLSNSELLQNYSEILALLKDRGVIRTKNLIGDLGEYYAVEHYNNTPGLPKLQAAPAGTQNIDAISTKGERYSIKSTTGKLTGVFYGLNPPDVNDSEVIKFEYVIIVLLDDNFGLNSILELTWDQFLQHKKWHKTMQAWNLSITQKLIADSRTVFQAN